MENALRAELFDGDRIIAGAPSLLRDLMAHQDDTLFNARIFAHIRGVMAGLARQLVSAQAEAGDIRDVEGFVADGHDSLLRELLSSEALLAHTHALAVEMQLIEQLQDRCGIDPVMPPLAQDRAASSDAGSESALLAAQARFVQQMRQMEHPLSELPDKVFHGVLKLFRSHAGSDDRSARDAVRQLRGEYDEGAGRFALIRRFLDGLDPDDQRILQVDQAGLSIFVSALARASGQDRDLIVLSLGERQALRLALVLRAAGLGDDAMGAQFLVLHPKAGAPEGFEAVSPDRAAAMLELSLAEARGRAS